MSYIIGTNIQINSSQTYFRVKGGSSNLTPRYNEWGGWVDICVLYYVINSGEIQIKPVNETVAIILETVASCDFGGSFDSSNDYYHCYNLYRSTNTPEKAKKYFEKLEKYDKERLEYEKSTYLITNERIEKFDNNFLSKLLYRLDNKEAVKKYIVGNKNNLLVRKVTKNWTEYTRMPYYAKKYSKFQALFIARNINSGYVTTEEEYKIVNYY